MAMCPCLGMLLCMRHERNERMKSIRRAQASTSSLAVGGLGPAGGAQQHGPQRRGQVRALPLAGPEAAGKQTETTETAQTAQTAQSQRQS